MTDEQRQTAKKRMMALMQEGYSWQEAARLSGIPTSRSTAYRWFQPFRTQGEAVLHDGRHGHIAKMHTPIREWLEARCRKAAKPAKLLSSERAERSLRGAGQHHPSQSHAWLHRRGTGLVDRKTQSLQLFGTPSDFSPTSLMLEELRDSRTLEGAWTATLWQEAGEQEAACRISIDGHRKPVYADKLIPLLRELKALGHTVVTVLRTDQYDGLESFTEVGMFVPLERDRHGQLVREVAPACFALPLPDQKGQSLPLRVALMRDLRRHVPCRQQDEETDEDVRKSAWWQADWKAEPTPATLTIAKLIPIVTTADTIDAVELAQTYTRRWPVQENIMRDFLLPLGLDTNHGYGKTPIVNSEEARSGPR